jgi:drug/metabolite transporter (DMT)-like permease
MKGHIALFVAQVIYALNYSIAKSLMPGFISPMSLVFSRIIGAAVLFWILSIFAKTDKIAREDFRKLLLLAVFGVVVNQIFFIYGLSLTSPINSSIILISNPIMVFIFTLIVLRERISSLQVSGLLLAISGAVTILLYKGNFEVGSETVAGDMLTFVNAASWAVFIVMAKPIMRKYNTVTAMRWMFLFGSLMIFPLGISDAIHTQWSTFTGDAWFNFAFVVIATTFFAYLLNVYGLETLSPNTVSAYIYLQPFLASLFAIAVGKDTLSATKIFSGMLIITGLYLITKKSAAGKTQQND